MLHRTRPRSQPPSGTGFSHNRSIEPRAWTSSIPYKLHTSTRREPSNKLSAILDAAVVEKASKKAGNLLLNSSSSSSSSSSLASTTGSSSLSLSTSSSTSTVLAVLDSLRPTNTKNNANNKSGLTEYQDSISLSAVPIANTSEEEDELDEAIIAADHSSASSSSSGLSSMSSCVPRLDQQLSTACQHPSSRQLNRMDSDELERERQVGECLSELVRSVVADAAPIEQRRHSDKLHKALPAQTKSSTSASSEDEEASSNLRLASKSAEKVKRIACLRGACSMELSKSQQVALFHYGDGSAVLRQARRSLSIAGQQDPLWVGLDAACSSSPDKLASLIWWPYDVSVSDRSQQRFECSLGELKAGAQPIDQIVRCLFDRDLIVWIILDHKAMATPRQNSVQLETTLDDIALALDEPIENHGEPFNPDNNNNQSETGYSALVWLFQSDVASNSFQESFRLFVSERGSLLASQEHPIEDQVSGSSTSLAVNGRWPTSRECYSPTLNTARETTGADSWPTASLDHLGKVSTCSSHYTKSSETASVTFSLSPVESSHQTEDEAKQSDERVVNHLRPEISSPLEANETAVALVTTSVTRAHAKTHSEQVQGSLLGESEIDRVLKGKAEQGSNLSDQSSTTAEVQPSTRVLRGNKNRSSQKTLNQTFASCQLVDKPTSTSTSSSSSSSGKATKLGGEKKDKLVLKKSASGSDLSQSPSSFANVGLASYYRTVASKVISNGQSKIKSFKDEMIKLNNRMPLSGSGTTSRRLSMLVSTHNETNKVKEETEMKEKDEEAKVVCGGAIKDRDQGTKRNKNDGQVDVNRAYNSNPALTASRQRSSDPANLPDSKEQNGVSNQTTPFIRPRTSILKNRQATSGEELCDTNNNHVDSRNHQSGCSNRSFRGKLETSSQSTSNCYHNNDQSRSSTLKGEIKAKRAVCGKPKSILKSSKSVSIVSGSKEEQVAVNKQPLRASCNQDDVDDVESSLSYHNGLETSRCKVSRSVATSSKGHLQRLPTDNDYDDDQKVVQESPYKTPVLNRALGHHHASGASFRALKRRSTYSVAEFVSNEKNYDCYDEDEDESKLQSADLPDADYDCKSSDGRERAFERLRSRASSYDITRLMSKNGLQIQLNKLRSGSTNSVSGKLRQRRPALLLDESTGDEVPVTKDDIYGDLEVARPRASESKESSAIIHVMRSSEPELSKLRSDRQTGNSGNSQECGQVSLTSRNEQLTTQRASSYIKKSEFDAQSLRRISTNMHTDGSIYSRQDQQRPKPVPKKNIVGQQSALSDDDDQVEVERGHSRDKVQKQHQSNSTPVIGRGEARASCKPDAVVSSGEESSEIEDEGVAQLPKVKPVANSGFAKSGPLSLLRQSFNQKTFSSMLKFSSRASMRIKVPSANNEHLADTCDKTASGSSVVVNDKATALAIAEANLQAAKQLKQQAQRLKDQQKREQQQQSVEATELMMAAVQYNQQIQRHQQQLYYQQQQQQQQFAIAPRGNLFNPNALHIQQQMFQQFQRQQHQQMAYMNTSQYMQQMTTSILGPPIAQIPAGQGMMYMPQAPMVGQAPMYSQQQISSLQQVHAQKKSILKNGNTKAQAQHHQLYPGQHLVPMAVNHHSSLNIVYAGGPSSSQIPQLQPPLDGQSASDSHDNDFSVNKKQPQLTKSSLGASMRRTVKSILTNKSHSQPTTNTQKDHGNIAQGVQARQNGTIKLKSALKSTGSRDLVLNSEGSDGDGSSSDSTTVASNSTNSLGYVVSQAGNSQHSYLQSVPKSALKKTPTSGQQDQFYQKLPVDTTFASNSSSEEKQASGRSTMSRMQSRVLDGHGDETTDSSRRYSTMSQSLSRSTPRRQTIVVSSRAPSVRKNVTFSSKLTSVL